MKHKEKPCRGTGKAKGHGCGSKQNHRKYGLGLFCGCYSDWLLNTTTGREMVERNRLKASNKVKKEQRKKQREQKEQIIDYSKKLQIKINEIVRLIDIGLPCLAKGIHPAQIHAGHILSRGSNSQARFNLHNIHRQSAQSNHFQNEDGLLREGLKKEYGESYYNFVMNMQKIEPLRYSNLEYKEFYKKACKIALDLKKQGKRYDKRQRINLRNAINLKLKIYSKEQAIFKK